MPRPWPHPDDPPDTRRTRLVLIVEIILIVIGMMVIAWPLAAKDRPIPARGTAFTCTPTAVWDGDGPIWCAEGPRLRIANINARELDNSCRPGAPCVATPGAVARDHMVALLGGAHGVLSTGHVIVAGPPLTCRSLGPDWFRRTLATCANHLGDIGEQLIAEGAVARWR